MRLRAFLRFFVLAVVVVLLTSRVMLLLHEFVGHGAAAMLFGGKVTGYWLFLFAGGRVSYNAPDLGTGPRLFINLGGILLELLLGACLIAIARRPSFHRSLSFSLLWSGGVVVGHGAVYLARGVHYGFGDGAGLARAMGPSRVIVVLASSVLAVGTALWVARQLGLHLTTVRTSKHWRAVAAAFLVFAAAGLVHGVLARVEVRYFPDPAWVSIMEEASVANARAELARRLAEAKRKGEAPPSDAERQRMLDSLEREQRPWPLDPILLAGVLLAFIVGLRRGVRLEHEAINDDVASNRALVIASSSLAAALVAILLLRAIRP